MFASSKGFTGLETVIEWLRPEVPVALPLRPSTVHLYC